MRAALTHMGEYQGRSASAVIIARGQGQLKHESVAAVKRLRRDSGHGCRAAGGGYKSQRGFNRSDAGRGLKERHQSCRSDFTFPIPR